MNKSKWNLVLNKLPTLKTSNQDELIKKSRPPLKRAPSCNESECDSITITFDIDLIYLNEYNFFNNNNSKSLSFCLAEDFYHRRTHSQSLPIYLNGLLSFENNNNNCKERIPNSITLIQAEYKVLKKIKNNNSDSFVTRFEPVFKEKSTQTLYTNIETLLIGTSRINYVHKCNPSKFSKGDYIMLQLGTYRECCLKLIDLQLTSQQIASFALNFLSNGIPVNLEHLKQIELINAKKYTQNDVDFLNRLIYHCWIKEVAKYMLPEEVDNNILYEKLPLATAHAMSLILLRHDLLDFSEVINNDARYGVYTGKQIMEPNEIENTKAKVKRIFRKYQKYQAESAALLENNIEMIPIVKSVDPQLKLEDEFMILGQVYGLDIYNQSSNLNDSILKKSGLIKI